MIWPRECEICSRPVDRPGRHVCSDCIMRLPFMSNDGYCRKCGRNAVGLDGEFLCDDCRTVVPCFDRAASSMRFEGDARQIVLDFKFNHHLWMKDDIVDWIESSARVRFKVDEIDLILPMPTTLWHRADRGYNQCAYLAKGLARRLDRPVSLRTIARAGRVQRQGGLDEEARRKNVVGSFKVVRPKLVENRTVLVVDDIMTTGSTLSECAKTLKKAGAARVWCVSIAHSIRDK